MARVLVRRAEMVAPRPSSDPFDGFVAVEPIGRGSFATVYRAVDAGSGQRVALKRAVDTGDDRLGDSVFEREARALGAVGDHPNIVTLHRVVARPGVRLLVLELCDGSLHDRVVRDGPLSVRDAVAVGIRLAGALEAAHRAGVLHRDVKPHNVLLTRYGEPALADFGAAELPACAALPVGGLTLLHAAPELILGEPASRASDVYGLASTLHELVSGQAPHFVSAHEEPARLRGRVLGHPVPQLDPRTVPEPFRRLVQRCLAKAPSDRPGSAREVAEHLRAVEQDHGWNPTPWRVEGSSQLTP